MFTYSLPLHFWATDHLCSLNFICIDKIQLLPLPQEYERKHNKVYKILLIKNTFRNPIRSRSHWLYLRFLLLFVDLSVEIFTVTCSLNMGWNAASMLIWDLSLQEVLSTRIWFLLSSISFHSFMPLKTPSAVKRHGFWRMTIFISMHISSWIFCFPF